MGKIIIFFLVIILGILAILVIQYKDDIKNFQDFDIQIGKVNVSINLVEKKVDTPTDEYISHCMIAVNKCSEIMEEKFDTKLIIKKVEKFTDLKSAQDFAVTWSTYPDDMAMLFLSDQLRNEWLNKTTPNNGGAQSHLPLTIVFAKISSGGSIVLVCNRDGTLLDIGLSKKKLCSF